MVRHRSDARCECRYHRSSGVHYGIEKLPVGTRVIDVDARPDERESGSSGCHGRGMRFGVDSCRTAGNDGRTVAHESRNETLGNFFSVWRSLSRSHDRDREIGLRDVSPDIEKVRASRHVEERGRIFVVAFGNYPRSCRPGTVERPHGGILEKSCGKHVETVFTNSGIGKKCSERGCGDGTQSSGSVRPNAGNGTGRTFERVRKEAEFAMGSSGRVQPDENFITHADRTRAG